MEQVKREKFLLRSGLQVGTMVGAMIIAVGHVVAGMGVPDWARAVIGLALVIAWYWLIAYVTDE